MRYLMRWKSYRGTTLNHIYEWTDDAQAERLAMSIVSDAEGDLIDVYPLNEGLIEKQARLALRAIHCGDDGYSIEGGPCPACNGETK